jgi:antitoxin CptB
MNAGNLAWQCRRGMLELDCVLQEFLQQRYPYLPAAQQEHFVALLQYSDEQLYRYLIKHEALHELPSELREIACMCA